MAYAYPPQKRIMVPAPQLPDPRIQTLIVPAPVPYFPVPVALDQARFLIPRIPRIPAVFRVSPLFLIRMDEQRTRSLIEFMRREGLEPSPEVERKREDVIKQLNKIIMEWIKYVALQRGLPIDVIAAPDAEVWVYGSYGLGVHGSDSDIDAICVAPYFATMEEDFFIDLHNMLLSRPEVSGIYCVKSAKVPLMRFKFNGVLVDFPFAKLQVISVINNATFIDPSVITDETSWRSLSGVHANLCIRQLVSNFMNFQSMLRCIKLWAKRRGIYSHMFCFFGGIHLAILSAYVCQRHPNASVAALLSFFFEIFSHWQWPDPVILQDRSIPYRHPDGRSLMPIMMPCYPFEWCNSNIMKSTFGKITGELQRAFVLTRNLAKEDFEWSHLFEPFPYTRHYAHFVRIFLAAPDIDELQAWVGLVKSRFRGLLLKLETTVQGYCDPNPTEYMDHADADPNTVFYWGLVPSKGIYSVDINSVKEDFMRSVNNDFSNESRSTRCRFELSIVGSNQLPKSIEIDSSVVSMK